MFHKSFSIDGNHLQTSYFTYYMIVIKPYHYTYTLKTTSFSATSITNPSAYFASAKSLYSINIYCTLIRATIVFYLWMGGIFLFKIIKIKWYVQINMMKIISIGKYYCS